MADSSLSVNTAVAQATLRQVSAKYLFQAGDDSPHLGRVMKWKDWVDEVLLALQQGDLDPAATLSATDLTLSDTLSAARLEIAGGTALNADGTDFVLSAGWGVGAAIEAASVVGTGSRFLLPTITPSGTPAANPTITLTFPVARASEPWGAIVQDWNFNSNAGAHSWAVDGLSSTTLTLRHVGTPVADERVGLFCFLIG